MSIHLNISHYWKLEELGQIVALSKETNQPISQWTLGRLHDRAHSDRDSKVEYLIVNTASLQARQAEENIRQTLNRLSAGLQLKGSIRQLLPQNLFMNLKALDPFQPILLGKIPSSIGRSFLVALMSMLLNFYSFAADGIWSSGSTTLAPTARHSAATEWTGSEMIVWSGSTAQYIFLTDGAKYNPAANTWTTLPTFGTFEGRGGHSSVWTGSEMIIWGGWADYPNFYNNGVRYNPSTNAWSVISQTNTPRSRVAHTAIWTGSKMIVWGGGYMPNAFVWNNLNDGSSFDPTNNTWTTISTVNAPTPRRGHTAVWTGNEMIIWSGIDNVFGSFLKSGAIYNPSTDTWRPMSAINSPSARNGHRSFWTGTKMIVWGGEESYQQQAPANTGGIYDLVSDSWTLIQNSPITGRMGMVAAWTGKEMVIWGGLNSSAWSVNYSDGARFNPTTGVWKMMESLGAPFARAGGAGFWSEQRLMFFGGGTNISSAVSGTYIYQFSPETPTITSAVAANIKSSEASIGGDVTTDGDAAITERGIVYSATATNADPLIDGTGVVKVTTTGTTGVFTVSVSGLTQATSYSYKAYATNSQGTSYTSVAGFTTLSALAPMVLTHPESQMIQFGGSATLSVAVDFSGPLSYQWKKGGVDIPSSNSATYAISNAQGSHAGSYTVVVSNADGSCEAGPAAVFVGTRRTAFVNANATGSNNGTSWADAYSSLTTALANALDGDDIWVASGTYKPSTIGNRDSTFRIEKFVRLLGGFNGTESSLSQRKWNTNATILSGDLYGNDAGLGLNQWDNSKRVVSISSTSGALIDGFIIRGGSNTIPGQAPDYGAGIGFVNPAAGVFAFDNCDFRWNSAVSYGGAIGTYGSEQIRMQVRKCQFIQNSAPFNGGGAIQGDEGWLIAKECLFMENTGSGSGAITMNNSRGFVAVNSVFSANTAGDGMQAHVGAGALRMWSLYNANYRIYGCTLRNNTNTRGSEGAVSLSTSASSGSLFSNSIIIGSGSNPVGFPFTTYVLSDEFIDGIGNMIGVPVFVNTGLPLGVDGFFGSADDGLALQPGSTGINAGSDNLAPLAVTKDVAGQSRIFQQVDVGAYEHLQLTNGDFELPTVSVTEGLNVTGTEVMGWTRSEPGNLTLLRNLAANLLAPKSGAQQVLFNAGDSVIGATIKTTIPTIVGRQYRVQFHVGRAGPGAGDMGLTARVRGASANLLFENRFQAPATQTYAPVSQFSFTATSPFSILSFEDTSLATVSVDVLLDAIDVTLMVVPTVTTPTITSPTATAVTLGGNITSDGGATITERGMVYSATATNADPLIGGTGVTKLTATGTTGVFTVQVSGLTQATRYSYKAYAINSQGISYTPAGTFFTLFNDSFNRFYWDPDGSASGNGIDGTNLGGAGTWDSTTLNWWPMSSGPLGLWGNTVSDRAIFTGDFSVIPTASDVTAVAGGVSANQLRFARSGYTLSGGAINLAGTTPTLYAEMGETATVQNILVGTAGLTKLGGGSIRLAGTNTYTGTTNIDGGSLIITSDSALGADSFTVNFTAGNNTPSNRSTIGFTGGSLVLDGTTAGFNLSRNLNLEGNGLTGNTGAALLSLGSNTVSGTLNTQSSDQTPTTFRTTRLTAVDGTLTLSGTVNVLGTPATNVTILGAGNQAGVGIYNLTGPLTGSGTLEKNGGGTLFFNPSSLAGFTGSLRISSSLTGTTPSSSTVRITTPLILGTNTGTAASSVIHLNGNGTLEIRMNAPTLQTFSGTEVVSANVYSSNPTATNVFVGHALGSSAVNGSLALGQLGFAATAATTFMSRDGYGISFTAAPVVTGDGSPTITNSLSGTLSFTGNFWSNSNTAAARTMTIAGNGNTTLHGNIIATGGASFDHILTKTGTGVLTITGTASTLDGEVNINGGAVALTDFRSLNLHEAAGTANTGTNINIGTSATTGNLIVGTTTAATSTGLTTNKNLNFAGTTGGVGLFANQTGINPVLFNATTLTVNGTANKILTLGGTNSGSNLIAAGIPAMGAGGVTKVGPGTWVLGGANFYSGATTIQDGTLKLNATAAVSGSVLSNGSNTVVFSADTVTQSAGGTLQFTGFLDSATSEELGILTPTAGAARLIATANGTGTTALTFTGLGARGAGATIDYQPGTNATISILGTSATVTNGILGAASASAFQTFKGVDWATLTSGVVSQFSDYNTTLPISGTAGAAVNYAIGSSTNTSGTASINTLKLIGSAGTETTINLGGLLTLTSRAILFENSGGAGIITGSQLGASATEVHIITNGTQPNNALMIDSSIGGTTGSLTKSGSGLLLVGGNNTFTGNIIINEGTVRLSGGTATLGLNSMVGNSITVRQGAILDINAAGASQTVNVNGLAGAGTVTNSGGGTSTAGTISFGSSTSTAATVFTGILQNGAGVLNVTVDGNTARTQSFLGQSTYTGVTNIANGARLTVDTLANGGFASGLGSSTEAASNLILSGSLIYQGNNRVGSLNLGSNSATTDRLFTLAGTSPTLSSIVNNGNSVVWSSLGTLLHATDVNRSLNLGGTSTGDNTLNPQLTNPATQVLSLNKTGAGQWNLGNSSNTYTGATTISEGILGLNDNGALPAGSSLVLSPTSATSAAILQMSGTFAASLSATPVTGTGTITWTGVTASSTGGAGFAPHTTPLTVAIGGTASPTALTWGSGGFVGTSALQNLVLGSTTALSDVDFRNAIDLGMTQRIVNVLDNTTTGADFATLSGVLSGVGGSFRKIGNGILRLTGANTYTGTTTVDVGVLTVKSLGSSTDATGTPNSVGVSGIAMDDTNAITLGTITNSGAILQYVGAGETSDRKIRFISTLGRAQIHADGSGPLILTNVANDYVTPTGARTLALRGNNTQGNMITSVLANDGGGGVLSVEVNGAATWILTNNFNSYTGGTTTGGALGLGGNSVIGTGTLIHGNGSIFAYGADRTITNALTLSNNAPNGWLGDYGLTFNGANNLGASTANASTLNSIVSGKALTLNGVTANSLTANRTWTFDGPGETVINGDFSTTTAFGVPINKDGDGTLTLGTNAEPAIGAAWNQAGAGIDVDRGTLKFGANNAMNSSASNFGGIKLSPEQATADIATLNLNGTSQTITSLTAISDGTARITNTAVGAASLTFGGGNTIGNFGAGVGSYSIDNTGGGALSLFKTGTDTTSSISPGVTLGYTGTTGVTGGRLTIASPLNGSSGLSVTNSGSSLVLSGGITNESAVTSVIIDKNASLSLLDGAGNHLDNLTNLTFGSSGGGTITDLYFNVGDLFSAGDQLNTDRFKLLAGGTLNLFAGNQIRFNLIDSGMNPVTTYTLLNIEDGGLTMSVLGAADWILGATPSVFSGFTLNVTNTLVQITTGFFSQAITFAEIPDQLATDSVNLTATGGGSGNAVTFAVTSGPGVITNNVLTFTSSGSVTITASQAGNESYLAAEDVSRTFNVTKVPIQFVSQPQPQTVNLGQAVTLNVTATGNGMLSYQWQKDGVDIPGATSSSFSLASAQPWHIGDYTVDVTDSAGTVTSEIATLSLNGVDSGIWNGLIGFWQFDGNLQDSSYFSRHMTGLQNSFAGDRFQYQNAAVQVQSGAYLTISPTPTNINRPFTISFWTKGLPSGADRVQTLISSGPDRANGLGCTYVPLPDLGGLVGFGTAWQQYVEDSGFRVKFINKWAQVTLIRKEGTFELWVNGTLIGSNNALIQTYDQGFLEIGRHSFPGYDYNSDVNIDSMRFYNRALSATEVQTLYASEADMPLLLSTPTSAQISAAGATLGGNVTSEGQSAISERGVVYSPTISNADPLIDGTGVTKLTAAGTTGVFTVPVSGLTQGTSYRFKAYATNSEGTSYTTLAEFTTLATQEINFAAITDKLTNESVDLVATGGDSGNPVTFVVTSGPAVITGNDVLSFTTSGSVTVMASQEGNDSYLAAPDVSRTFMVSKAMATVTLGNLTQTYNNTPRAATASTVPTGLAVNLTYDESATAPTAAGTYAVVGTIDDPMYQGSASGNLVIGKASQAISFAAISNRLTTNTVTLSATGGASSNPVTFAVTSGPGVITGNVLSFTTSGSVTVTASQAGNNNYAAATPVSRSLTVTKVTATVTLASLTQTYNNTPRAATASTVPTGLAVNLTYQGSATAPTEAGTYAVVATINDPMYQGSASGSLVIGKASQAISFAAIADKLTTDTVELSATGGASSNPVTFAVTSGPGVITGNVLSFTTSGSVTVTASQAGNNNYLAATPVSRTFTVTKATATVTLGSLAQTYDGTQRAATATTDPANLNVEFSYGGTPTLPTNVGTYAVVATVNDLIYQGSDTGTLSIGKESQTITFAAIADQLTTDSINLSATGGSSGNPVTFAVTSGPGLITNNVLTFTTSGSVTVTASQAGNDNYLTAENVSRSFNVTKVMATVTLGNLVQTYDGTQRVATATTEPINLNVDLTYGGSPTPPTNVGTYEVVATINNLIYQGSATGTLSIGKESQVITFATIADQLTTDSVNLTATGGGSGNPVTFAVTSGPAVITNNVLTFVTSGSVTITASQAGNDNYLAAEDVSRTFTVTKAMATVTLGSLGQTYDGTQRAATATTNPINLSVEFSYGGSPTAPTNVGSYEVLATVNDLIYQGSAIGTLSIGKGSQTVTFATIADQLTFDSVTLTATGGGSGNPVTFAVTSGPAVITNNALTFTNSGSVTITASQAGNDNYLAAEDVSRTFKVGSAQIATQPQPATVEQNGSATLSVVATGVGTLVYQWQKDGVDLVGETGATLTITLFKPWHVGSYRVRVSDSLDSAWSSTAQLSLSATQPASLWQDLLLFLPFAGNTTDLSPYARTITQSNVGVGDSPDGTAAGSASFNGTSSRMDFSPNLPDLAEMTFSTWIRPTTTSGQQFIFADWDDAASNDVNVALIDDKIIVVSTKNGANLIWTSQPIVRAGEWMHLTFVMGATRSLVLVNGQVIATLNTPANNVGYKLRSNIGYFNYGAGEYFFAGNLSALRIYGRALSESEAMQLYQYDDAPIPQIEMEQPTGTVLVDGSATTTWQALPTGGSAVSAPYKIRNAGVTTLRNLSLTKSGTHATDFLLGNLTTTTLAPGQSTSFTVTFAPRPGASGSRSATLQVASNDPDENPFDIALTGEFYSTTQDADNDGMNDWGEYKLSALGFDWQVPNTDKVNSLYDNAGAAGLVTTSQVQNLNVGTPLLQRDPATGEFTLTIGVNQSSDLRQWTPLPMTVPQTIITNQGKLEFRFTAPDNAAFFRLQTQPAP